MNLDVHFRHHDDEKTIVLCQYRSSLYRHPSNILTLISCNPSIVIPLLHNLLFFTAVPLLLHLCLFLLLHSFIPYCIFNRNIHTLLYVLYQKRKDFAVQMDRMARSRGRDRPVLWDSQVWPRRSFYCAAIIRVWYNASFNSKKSSLVIKDSGDEKKTSPPPPPLLHTQLYLPPPFLVSLSYTRICFHFVLHLPYMHVY